MTKEIKLVKKAFLGNTKHFQEIIAVSLAKQSTKLSAKLTVGKF